METIKIKRNLTVIELIIQGVAFLLLFLPGMYNWEHWEQFYDVYGGGYTLKARFSRSFVDILGLTNGLLGCLVIGLMVINIILLLYYIFKSGKFNVAYIIVPILSIILLIVFSLLANIMDDYGYCAPINWLFYVEMFLLIAVSIISFMKYFKRPKDE